jgi:small subunit ribosomal protein S8
MLKKRLLKFYMIKGISLSKFEEDDKQGIIKIALKYNQSTKVPAITKLERASRPGLRKYCGADTLPRVLNGLGIAIVSTSKGIITNKEAKTHNIGGEVLCYVY